MMKEEKRTIYISASANEILTDYLEDRGYAITRIGASDCVSAPVSDHPDMFMCKFGADNGRIVMWSDIEAVDAAGLRSEVKIYVSGMPVTQAYADEIEADHYCEDARDTIDYAESLVS